MLYIAFTLGFFGSLHCLGMCGPLAIAFSNKSGYSRFRNLLNGIQYNLGRVLTYGLLGVLFGLLGSFLFLADLQKTLSVVLGVLLILSFLFSINIDHQLQSLKFIKGFYNRVQKLLSQMMNRTQKIPSFFLGIANGFLPCGLVYLALAGSLSTGHIWSGFSFMVFFGMGTIPMLLGLSSGTQLISQRLRTKINSIIPYVSLAFGIFLIYRGIVVDIPTELNFWEALKNPIMCH